MAEQPSRMELAVDAASAAAAAALEQGDNFVTSRPPNMAGRNPEPVPDVRSPKPPVSVDRRLPASGMGKRSRVDPFAQFDTSQGDPLALTPKNPAAETPPGGPLPYPELSLSLSGHDDDSGANLHQVGPFGVALARADFPEHELIHGFLAPFPELIDEFSKKPEKETVHRPSIPRNELFRDAADAPVSNGLSTSSQTRFRAEVLRVLNSLTAMCVFAARAGIRGASVTLSVSGGLAGFGYEWAPTSAQQLSIGRLARELTESLKQDLQERLPGLLAQKIVAVRDACYAWITGGTRSGEPRARLVASVQKALVANYHVLCWDLRALCDREHTGLPNALRLKLAKLETGARDPDRRKPRRADRADADRPSRARSSDKKLTSQNAVQAKAKSKKPAGKKQQQQKKSQRKKKSPWQPARPPFVQRGPGRQKPGKKRKTPQQAPAPPVNWAPQSGSSATAPPWAIQPGGPLVPGKQLFDMAGNAWGLYPAPGR